MKSTLLYLFLTCFYLTNYAQTTIEIADASATEGLPVAFVIRLDSNDNGILLNLNTLPWTATSDDYTGYSSILSFQPGETSKTLIVETTDDTIEEENEFFTVQVSLFGSNEITSATMTIIDNDGDNGEVPEPCSNAPTLSYSGFTNPTSCSGTGEIQLTTTNLPNGNYTINSNNGALNMTVSNNSATLTDLATGTYTWLTMTYNNCVINSNINVTLANPDTPSLSFLLRTHPNGCETDNGAIRLATTNLPDGQYAVSTTSMGSFTMNVTNNVGEIQNLGAGTYSDLSVTYNNCTSDDDLTVTLDASVAPSLTLYAYTHPRTCNGNDGSISFTTIGLPDGDYNIYNNGLVTISAPLVMNVTDNLGTISDLAPGNYGNFYLTYNGCEAVYNGGFSLNEPSAPSIALTEGINPSGCGTTDGSIRLSTTGLPDGAYQVTHSSGSFTMNVTSNVGEIQNLSQGTYSNLSLTYNNCSSNADINVTLNDPAAPLFGYDSFTHPSACNANDGSITFITSGLADGDYNVYSDVGISISAVFTMSVTNNVGTISNLAPEAYGAFYLSYNNCIVHDDTIIVLAAPSTPSIALAEVINPSDCDSSNGSIRLNTSGLSNGDYEVTYDNGILTMNVSSNVGMITDLPKGTYSNLVVTNLGCTSSEVVSTTLTASCAFVATFSNIPTGTGYYINKLIASPPQDVVAGTDDLVNEYFEFIGDANESIPSDLYFIMIEGDGSNGATDMGKVKEAIQLGAARSSFGSNGIFALTSNYTLVEGNQTTTYTNPYSAIVNSEAEILAVELFGPGPITSSSSSAVTTAIPDLHYDGNLTDASATYMLISSPTDPNNHDLDLDNDGQIDSEGAHTEWVLYDSVSYLDADDLSTTDGDGMQGEFGYGQVVFARNYEAASDQYHVTEGAEIVAQGNANISFLVRLANEGFNHTAQDWVGAANASEPTAPYWAFSTSENKVSNTNFVGYQMRAEDYGALMYSQTALSTKAFENNLSGIQIFPNPTQDWIQVSESIDLITVYNLQGLKLKSTTETSLDISKLATGMYLVVVEKDGLQSAEFIVKE